MDACVCVCVCVRKSGVRDKKLRAPLTTDKVGESATVDENARSIRVTREPCLSIYIYAVPFTIIAFHSDQRGHVNHDDSRPDFSNDTTLLILLRSLRSCVLIYDNNIIV